ncbi:MAG: hypothetical protein JSW07_13650 [bacterium]|nr:MAG: hypothetical protein JSW07_13650 [bacterium]
MKFSVNCFTEKIDSLQYILYELMEVILVFQAFELPGVIWEDARNRVWFGFSRDSDGFIAEVNKDFLEMTVLWDESFDSTLPFSYDQDVRSLQIIEVGQLKLKPKRCLSMAETSVKPVMKSSHWKVLNLDSSVAYNRRNIMKIELIADTNCISFETYAEIKDRLAREFSIEAIKVTSFVNQRQRLRNLGVNLLPVWLIDDEVQRVNPGDYNLLRDRILSKSKEKF